MIRRVLLFGVAAVASAHEPITTKLTWTQEISRIFYKRCVACHREGPAAPMALASYDEVRPWAKAIRDEVLERRMPPWDAVKGFGEFRDDAGLSQTEIEMIAAWVEGGAPKGEDVYLPSLPEPEAASAPRAGSELALSDGTVLQRAVTALGIRPQGPVQAVARRPDGALVPLVWVRKLHGPPHVYWFRAPLRLPAGTRVELAGAAVALIISRPKPAR